MCHALASRTAAVTMVPLMVAVVRLLLPGLLAVLATPTPVAATIPPVVWELVSFTEPTSAPVTIADPTLYTVQFLPDGELVARLDCNHGRGGYTASQGRLALTALRATRMRCPSASAAMRFQTILQGATSYAFDPDGLLLLHGDTGSLRLRPVLTGVLWAWQTFQGGDGTMVRPDDPSQYTVAFLPDGTLAIQADGHPATGTYTVDHSTIDLRIDGETGAASPPGSPTDRFLSDLDQVASHVFRDGNLYLALPMDAGILAFAPTSVVPPAATPAVG